MYRLQCFGRAFHNQIEPMRCSCDQPPVLHPNIRSQTVADDHGRRSAREVQDTADCVIQGSLGIEAPRGRIRKPFEESVEETAEPVDRVPFPCGVEVKA
ncbi:hypothetical protein GCM10023405_31480 [Streptomonospora salina]